MNKISEDELNNIMIFHGVTSIKSMNEITGISRENHNDIFQWILEEPWRYLMCRKSGAGAYSMFSDAELKSAHYKVEGNDKTLDFEFKLEVKKHGPFTVYMKTHYDKMRIVGR